MPGKKASNLPLATSVQGSDTVIGQANGRTSRIPISTLQGLTGVKGDIGPQGAQGQTGEQGPGEKPLDFRLLLLPGIM